MIFKITSFWIDLKKIISNDFDSKNDQVEWFLESHKIQKFEK